MAGARKAFRTRHAATLDAARKTAVDHDVRSGESGNTPPHVGGHSHLRPTLTLPTPATLDAARLAELDQFEAEHA